MKAMSFRTKMTVVPLLLFSCVTFIVCHYADSEFVEFYAEKMRSSLFAGFFTLSGFLMSAKTFIILNLKKEMFSTKTYMKQVRKQSQLAQNGTIEVYRPLRNVGNVLLMNVALCLVASIAQFTLGLFPTVFTVSLCLGTAAAASSMMVFSLLVIARNLHDMYDHFEEEAKEALNSEQL